MRSAIAIGLLGLCLAGPVHARSASGVNAAKLAQLEKELSLPICGVGYLDTRQGQLDAIVKKRPLPYLEHMARATYANRRSLAPLAIQLLGRNGSTGARRILVGLVKDDTVDGHRRDIAARELALRFADGTGRQRLLQGMQSSSVQHRADSLSALLPVLRAKDRPALLRVARDRAFYVVDRLVHELDARASLKARVLADMSAAIKTSAPDDAGRLALTSVLLGDARHRAKASTWLTKHPPATTNDELYQLGQACHALAQRGHREGLDGALHLVSTYAGPGPASWKRYVLSAMFTYAEPPAAWRELAPAASLPKLQQFWSRERPHLRFDAKAKRFIR